MSKHYVITIKIAYDETTVPDPELLEESLHHNVRDAVKRGLLIDGRGEAIVEEYKVVVEPYFGN